MHSTVFISRINAVSAFGLKCLYLFLLHGACALVFALPVVVAPSAVEKLLSISGVLQ